MPAIEVKPGIHWIGINDRTTDLFEGIWPISDSGVSYNSYLINDQKKAIIDLAKANLADDFFAQIEDVIKVSDIDYIVINHMEPDHSGLVKTLRRISPSIKIIGSEKTKKMLAEFFSITKNVEVVSDGDTLPLGKNTLKFISAPFLHWPETMMTYEIENRILFSCDAFGGYGAIQGAIFDDECKQPDFYEKEALRYYVNIVANFSARVLGAIERLKDLPVEVIAPSHGLIWRENTSRIVNLYKQWAECASGKTEPGITLIYGSMYGNTERMMNAVARGISRTGLPIEIFDAARTHVSYILPSLWTKNGVMIGAPTYEVSLFPPMADVLNMAAHKRVKNKKAAYFGSYGWSGGGLRDLKKIVEPLNWELMDVLEFIGGPKDTQLRLGERFGEKLAQALLED